MDEGGDFWRFSVGIYRDPGVSGACLALQDGLGIDVNLLLFCLYAGARGHLLSIDELHRLDQAVADWRDHVVRPLREARRWLKTAANTVPEAAQALRKQVLAAELEAEHQQQTAMQALMPLAAALPSAEASAANLTHYILCGERSINRAQLEALSALWLGAHPEQDATSFAQRWKAHLAGHKTSTDSTAQERPS